MIELLKKYDPRLYINENLYIELMSYALSTDLEMTMVLSITKETEEEYRITKINIPPQFNAGTETKTLDEKYPQWCFEQVKKDIVLNGHLHTHPKFSVNPSGYDDNFFKDLIKQTNTFQFRLILNQKGNIRVDIIDAEHNYYKTDIGLYIECDKITLFTDSTTSIVNISADPDIKYTPNPKKYEYSGIYGKQYHGDHIDAYEYNIFNTEPSQPEDLVQTKPDPKQLTQHIDTKLAEDDVLFLEDFYYNLEYDEKLYLAELITREFSKKENK